MDTYTNSTALPEDRVALEALIEAAIARLDELDGDPDLEPTLGAPELHRLPFLSQEHWAEGASFDEREDDDPAEEDDPLEPNGDELDYLRDSEEEDLLAIQAHHQARSVRYDFSGERQDRERTAAVCDGMLADVRAAQSRQPLVTVTKL